MIHCFKIYTVYLFLYIYIIYAYCAVYRTVSHSGPSHSRHFTVAVYFRGERIGKGEGTSIQKARFNAAENALQENKGMADLFHCTQYDV